MNDTYINYIDQLLDLAERNDIFCLTTRAFNEFAVGVREALEKQVGKKVVRVQDDVPKCPHCESYKIYYFEEDTDGNRCLERTTGGAVVADC